MVDVTNSCRNGICTWEQGDKKHQHRVHPEVESPNFQKKVNPEEHTAL
jgi:hypothetical protein